MADDDHNSVSEENDEKAPTGVPSHDPLPLPPEVHYTRPSSVHRTTPAGQNSRNEYGFQNLSAPSPVRYATGLAGGITLMSSILAGYWLGSQVDARYIHGTTPWATIVMVLAGTFVGFYNMFRLLNRSDGPKK